jgi:hypothetical protein
MLKKIMLMATAVTAMFAIGAQAASAEWYDKGTALVAGENPTLEATGTVAFTSTAGGVHCNTGTAKLQATGGEKAKTTGHVLSFGVEETSKCEVSGSLVFLTGGSTTLETVTLTQEPTKVEGTPEANNATSHLEVKGIELHNKFTNGFELTLFSEASPLKATPVGSTTAISSATLSGELNSTLSVGKVKVAGTLEVLGAAKGTYGLVA